MQNRFTDSYYLYNSLLVLLYLPLRLYFRIATPDGSDYSRLHSVHEFSTWVCTYGQMQLTATVDATRKALVTVLFFAAGEASAVFLPGDAGVAGKAVAVLVGTPPAIHQSSRRPVQHNSPRPDSLLGVVHDKLQSPQAHHVSQWPVPSLCAMRGCPTCTLLLVCCAGLEAEILGPLCSECLLVRQGQQDGHEAWHCIQTHVCSSLAADMCAFAL
jgi:hypothetical protein